MEKQPWALGQAPVSSEARAGVQTGLVLNACVKAAPPDARRSSEGVCTHGLSPELPRQS